MDELGIEKIREKYPEKLTRKNAIKLYCKHICCAGDMESWKNCPTKSCFLFPFRGSKEKPLLKENTSKKGHILSVDFSKNEVLGEVREWNQ